MDIFSNKKNGFTIVEVLVSVGIMVVFLPFAASMLTNSQLLASYSKHKIQAAYAAQQILESERQLPFAQVVSQPAGAVILDTKGNYTNTTCSSTNINIFCGTALITVAPAVYTNSAGVSSTNPLVAHVVVKINWSEQILKIQVPMTETYAEDVLNDPMLN